MFSYFKKLFLLRNEYYEKTMNVLVFGLVSKSVLQNNFQRHCLVDSFQSLFLKKKQLIFEKLLNKYLHILKKLFLLRDE